MGEGNALGLGDGMLMPFCPSVMMLVTVLDDTLQDVEFDEQDDGDPACTCSMGALVVLLWPSHKVALTAVRNALGGGETAGSKC